MTWLLLGLQILGGLWIADSLWKIAGLLLERYTHNKFMKEWTAWKAGRQ